MPKVDASQYKDRCPVCNETDCICDYDPGDCIDCGEELHLCKCPNENSEW